MGPVCDPGLVNSIPEIKSDMENVLLYPNPTYGTLQMKLPESFILSSNSSIEIIDMAGVIQMQKIIKNGNSNIEIGLEELSPGIYFIIIKNTDTSITAKVIKM